MDIRFGNSIQETSGMNTGELRNNFLVQHLMKDDEVNLTYSHYDRMIIGGISPKKKKISLPVEGELKSTYFLERREMGIINVGGNGTISVEGKAYNLDKLDCLYIGKETKEVIFGSTDALSPAQFYLLSTPAHKNYPTTLFKKDDAQPVYLGNQSTGNVRTIYKYIHLDGIKSCQLVMGCTLLQEGSLWNSVPPHTHTRRSEVYFYFDVPDDQRVFHFMGTPQQTRHIVASNHDAVISPPWSVHFGCGTKNYGFIWGMAGENQAFDDMDVAMVHTLL